MRRPYIIFVWGEDYLAVSASTLHGYGQPCDNLSSDSEASGIHARKAFKLAGSVEGPDLNVTFIVLVYNLWHGNEENKMYSTPLTREQASWMGSEA